MSSKRTVLFATLMLSLGATAFVSPRAQDQSGAGVVISGQSAANRSEKNRNYMPIDINAAQQALKDEGLYQGPIDGAMGPETARALKRFQSDNGLKQTATLDEQTQDQLVHADND